MKKKPKDRPEPAGTSKAPTGSPKRKPRLGLPDPSTVVTEESFLSPKGKPYRIIRTSQKDAYDNDETEAPYHKPLTNEDMTKRRADEPDNKAAERLREFNEARGISDNYPEEKPEPPEKKTRKPTKTKKRDEGTTR
ncbi:hypothetical protein [Spirosoma aerophilum]